MNTNNRYYIENSWVHLAIIFIFLIAFGFPGSYTRVVGNSTGMLLEYSAFLLEILIMLLSSSDHVLDIKIISMDERFAPIYFFIAEMFVASMIVSCDKKEQLISCIRVTVTIIFAIWIIEHLSIKELLEELYYTQILFILASVAFPILFHAYDYRPASYANDFVGIGGVKNVIAAELSFGIAMQFLLWRIKIKEKEHISIWFIGMFAVQFVLLLMTHGTGSLFVTIINCTAIFLSDTINPKRYPVGALYIAGSVLFIVIAMTFIPLFEPFLTAIGKDATLTGRIPLWRQLIRVMQEHRTMFGYGYGMFWKDSRAIGYMHAGFDSFSFMANMTSGAHNNIMELWANMGLVGVGTFFGVVLLSLRDLDKMDHFSYLFVMSFMLFYMMRGWTERCWSTYDINLMVLFMVLAMPAKSKITT